jgi:hypothetical protein
MLTGDEDKVRRLYRTRSIGELDIAVTPGTNGGADIVWLFGTEWERGEFARMRAKRQEVECERVLSAPEVEHKSARAKQPRRKRQPRQHAPVARNA